jgi:pimeloyl-ACP methyl ester carboxylesterase
MGSIKIGRHRINFGLHGDEGRDVIVFINGLTQSTVQWAAYQEQLAKDGYRVLTYDMLGQGESSKPVLHIPLDDHAEMLYLLLDALNIERCHLAGISFGGVVGLHTAIRYPERIQSLVAMSTFCSMPMQLQLLGAALHAAMVQVGFPLVQALLLPMNLSSDWLQQAKPGLKEMVRKGYAINDPYAIQNLMESFVNFQDFSAQLSDIQCPTLIVNGEFDYLTPRDCHEELRSHIANSRLMIFPRGYHAFTLENPRLTMRIIDQFICSVRGGTWQGDQSVWVANEDLHSETVATRCAGDHMRAVFLAKSDATPAEEWKMASSSASAAIRKMSSATAARKRPGAAANEKARQL